MFWWSIYCAFVMMFKFNFVEKQKKWLHNKKRLVAFKKFIMILEYSEYIHVSISEFVLFFGQILFFHWHSLFKISVDAKKKSLFIHRHRKFTPKHIDAYSLKLLVNHYCRKYFKILYLLQIFVVASVSFLLTKALNRCPKYARCM